MEELPMWTTWILTSLLAFAGDAPRAAPSFDAALAKELRADDYGMAEYVMPF